jgi:hypothetical protein
MRHLKVLGVALLAIFAFGMMATSAFAEGLLPMIHCLKEEEPKCYPLHLNFADNKVTPTVLRSTGGGKLEGKGVSVLLLTTELTSLGTFSSTFLAVKKGTTPCNSVGDAKEVVLVKGEFHIVYIHLSPKETLTIGAAFLVEPLSIECAAVTVKVLGCALAGVEGLGQEDVTTILGLLQGDEKGKNLLTKYWDNEKELECKLLSDFETGEKQSEESVGTSKELITLASLNNQMFTILNI